MGMIGGGLELECALRDFYLEGTLMAYQHVGKRADALFGLLAVGNILYGTDHQQWLAIGITLYETLHMQIAKGTILQHNAMVDTVGGAGSACCIEGCVNGAVIIGMHALKILPIVGCELVRFISEQVVNFC